MPTTNMPTGTFAKTHGTLFCIPDTRYFVFWPECCFFFLLPRVDDNNASHQGTTPVLTLKLNFEFELNFDQVEVELGVKCS